MHSDPYNEAVTLLSYLKNCDYNTFFHPYSVIPFSFPGDPRRLVDTIQNIRAGAPEDPDQREVCKINTNIKCN